MSYDELTEEVLGRPLPLLLPPESTKNIGGLSDRDDAEVAVAVCRANPGMDDARWATLDVNQRIPWLEATVAAKTAAQPIAAPPPVPPEPPVAPQVFVDLACKSVTLDGKTFDLRSDCALRWLKVLADHPGEWISSSELTNFDIELDGARPDRLKKFFPQEIAALIESDRRKGSRLRLSTP